MTTTSPLTGPPPEEIPLANAPLVRVLAQIRFPMVASIDSRGFIAPFQESIRRDYPILRPEQNQNIVLGNQGIAETKTTSAWRFSSKNENWRVTLAPDFVSLETSQYSSRDDFLQRFKVVLDALITCVDPQVIDRLGVRYIDRIAGVNLQKLPKLIRPEVCGILATPLATDTLHSISELMLKLPECKGQLMARWGLVPANATVDPAMVDPIETASWLLDLDAFSTKIQETQAQDLIDQTRAFMEQIYRIFRWAVTDEFLDHYGRVQ